MQCHCAPFFHIKRNSFTAAAKKGERQDVFWSKNVWPTQFIVNRGKNIWPNDIWAMWRLANISFGQKFSKYLGTRVCIQNTSFSSLLTNGSYKLQHYITLGWKGLPGTNTLANWAHSYVSKKMKCCECDPWLLLMCRLNAFQPNVIQPKGEAPEEVSKFLFKIGFIFHLVEGGALK